MAHLINSTYIADAFHDGLLTQSPELVEEYRTPGPSTHEFITGNRVVRLCIDDDADPNTVLCSVHDKTMTFEAVAYPSIFADVEGAIDKAAQWLD